MRKPPTQEELLKLAQMYWTPPYPNEIMSWTYLFCWGMYEAYIDGWWQE